MKKTKDNKSRRNFLREGLKLGTGVVIGTKNIIDESSEMVKMLTADGKVVEVRSSQIINAKNKTKNKEILDWVKNPGINNKSQ